MLSIENKEQENSNKIKEQDYNTNEGKEIYFVCTKEECNSRRLQEIITSIQTNTTIVEYVAEDEDGEIHITEKEGMSDIGLSESCSICYRCLECGELLFDVQDVNIPGQELAVYLKKNCNQD